MVKSRSSLIESSRVDRTAATEPDESNARMLSKAVSCVDRLGRSVESRSGLIESSEGWKAAEQFRDHEPYKPKTQNPKP